MPIKIRHTQRGVTVRATGQDAQRLLAALTTWLQAGQPNPGSAELQIPPTNASEPVPNRSKTVRRGFARTSASRAPEAALSEPWL